MELSCSGDDQIALTATSINSGRHQSVSQEGVFERMVVPTLGIKDLFMTTAVCLVLALALWLPRPMALPLASSTAQQQRALLPIEPLVLCHSRVNKTHCATVFGYRNPNNVTLNVAIDSRWNYFLPRPFDRGQPSQFLSSSSSSSDSRSAPFIATHALWRCGGAMLPSRMRKLTWTIRTEHPTRWQSRQARADRSAEPCPDDVLALFVSARPEGSADTWTSSGGQ